MREYTINRATGKATKSPHSGDSSLREPEDTAPVVEVVPTSCRSVAGDGETTALPGLPGPQSEAAAPEAALPESTPFEPAPSEPTPSEATPSEATPSEATPSEATPSEATPSEATLPESALPESAPSEAALPESAPSEAALPEAALPEPALQPFVPEGDDTSWVDEVAPAAFRATAALEAEALDESEESPDEDDRELTRVFSRDVVDEVGSPRATELCRRLRVAGSALERSTADVESVALVQKQLFNELGAIENELRRLLDVRKGTSSPGASGIRGSLTEVTVTEVLEFVRLTKKSGVLRVKTDSAVAQVRFLEGDAIYAETDRNTAFDAFCELLEWKAGYLQFDTGEVNAAEINLHHSTLELMMRALRQLDERASQLRR